MAYDDHRLDERCDVSAHLVAVLELTTPRNCESPAAGVINGDRRDIWFFATSESLASQLGLDYSMLEYPASEHLAGRLLIRLLDEALKHGYLWTVDHGAGGNPEKIAERLLRDLDVDDLIASRGR